MDKILSIIRSEPIRVMLYPILVVIIGALVAKGVVSDFSADTIIALVAAVLGIPAAEAARGQVWPSVKLTIDPDGNALR